MISSRHWLRGAMIAGSLVFAVLAVMALRFGLRDTADLVARGLPIVPLTLLIGAAQLALAGLAWGALLGQRLPVWLLVRARWVREAVNSILPVASLGGSVVGARLLARAGGVPVPEAGASAAADVTGEAIAQFLFLLAALLLASTLPHAPFRPMAILLPVGAAVAALVLAQALGAIAWLERLAMRVLPARLAVALAGIDDRLRAIYAAPWRMAGNIGWNFLSWSVGALEVVVLLKALGHPVPWRASYAIEGLGIVARSLGFALPAGIGAQETGFVLAGMLFGVPREVALALSVLKRVREVISGIAGLGYWQWREWREAATKPGPVARRDSA